MIGKNEINRLATEKNVNPGTIDKDWVLGHIVDAIYSIPECRENLLFKGLCTATHKPFYVQQMLMYSNKGYIINNQ
jgi:hypothetical protein